MPRYIRHFSTKHMEPTSTLQKVLIKWLTGDRNVKLQWSEEDKECISSLKEAGILTDAESEIVEFTCRLAQRYYTKKLFPNRGVENPSSLHDLIWKVIGSMSMSFIKRSIAPTYEFPLTTASFLSQFITGIALSTLRTVRFVQMFLRRSQEPLVVSETSLIFILAMIYAGGLMCV
ncbi:hypothetical protein JG688_00013196 [Phytophthora aleatoria]|uniref:Uncharacterized protein n=1 Tax=Phytophthora aleatoria TaxID=2496075 RepID=A0A8J5IXN1_9STRA|nr:hypothetical protein JG688_00013196 [Phytophthora aleatoria]